MQCLLTLHRIMAIVSLAALTLPAGALAQPVSDGGESAVTPAQDLEAMALAAQDQFIPYPAERVPQAEVRVRRAIQQLDAFLATGTKENAASWKEYLQWDAMLTELDKPGGLGVAQLAQFLRAYYRNYTSLDHPAFREMRGALLDYRNALAMASEGRLPELYRAQLDVLAKLLRDYEQTPTMELNQKIGALVGWLEIAGQAKDLVGAIRQRYWQPNLYASLSQNLINTGLSIDIVESDDVRDCILGTAMVGAATMKGRTVVELLDCADAAHIRLSLTGTIHTDNVGFNRGVRIYSQGETLVRGSKTIRVHAEGFDAQRSSVQCSTRSTIDGITANSCLVEKIAWKRARRSKGSAEQIGSHHAEERVAERMDERANELLQQSRDDYQERFRKPLLRRDEFPQDMRFRTKDGRLDVVWRQAGTSQLASPDRPPPVQGLNDLAVQLHESFVSNFSRAMLGGVRLTDKRLVELLEKNDLEVPEAVRPSDDKADWAITFSSREPVNATFSGQTIRFAIRGRKFELGEQVVNKELEMSAIYELEKTPEGARLTRKGDVSVDYLGVTGELNSEDIVVRVVMREKFEALFTPEFETTGIKLPGRWSGAMLHLEQLAADRGWLSLAWTQSALKPAAANP